MGKFSINDWLTLQTRKDLTFIRRNLEHESVNYAIFADLFIALFSFVLDHILRTVDANTGLVEQISPSWLWIVTAILLVAVPAIIFIFSYRKKKKYQSDEKMVMPVEYLVDLFDNEICYNVMTADSMRDHMLDESESIEKEIQQFYFIEALYYANKTSTQLNRFKNQGRNAIRAGDSIEGVSFIRFRNVCEIIMNIYKALNDFSTKKGGYKVLMEDKIILTILMN